MLCPVCKVDLKMSERQGIEIDYCPNCRGVWLDRGELDKIIDRSLEYEQRIRTSGAAPQQTPSSSYPDDDDDYKRKNDARPTTSQRPYDDRRYDDDRKYDDRRYEKRRKGSFLDDIFDIFD